MSAKGAVTDEQQQWLEALHAAGAETWLVRPRDYDRFLERLAGACRE